MFFMDKEEYDVDDETRKVLDETRKKAWKDMVEALEGMSGRFTVPFSWRPPTLSPSQLEKAKKLAARPVHRRFIDLSFRPEEDPEEFLLASFKVVPPKGEDLEEVANHVTLESSTGTWTDVQTETSYTLSLAGIVYQVEPEVEGPAGHVLVAYPIALFEPGSIAQLLSCIGGNIMAMKAVKSIKLMDFRMPMSYLATFPGPRFGIRGIREVSGVKGHSLVGTIVKPKTGLFAHEYARVLGDTFRYCCVVKDDENLTDQEFNPFDLRAVLCYREIEKVEAELTKQGIKERKIFLPNVTSRDAVESLYKAYFVKALGARAAMIDIITAGFETVQMLRNWGPPLILHGHRAMHAAFARPRHHGVDMMPIAKACRMAGIDELHIGTVVGKMEGDASEVLNYHHAISDERFEPLEPEGDGYQWFLPQDWGGMRPVMSVNSGGLYPKHMLELSRLFGTDTVTTMGGGIHAYGTLDGAWGARLAAEAAAAGYSLQDVAADYDNKVKEIGFTFPRPWDEAGPILERVIGSKDWEELAFSDEA